MVSSFKIQTSRRKPRSELSDLAMKIVKNQSQLKGNCFALPVGAENSSHRSYSGNYLRKQKHLGSCESRLRHEKKHENFGSLEELDDGLTLKIAQISRGDIYVSFFTFTVRYMNVLEYALLLHFILSKFAVRAP